MTALIRKIEAAGNQGTLKPPYAMRYHAHEPNGLPTPVQRYFRAVLKDGQARDGACGTL